MCEVLNIDTDVPQTRAGYVLANCPLAPTNHRHGYDSDSGFAMKIEPGRPTITNCFFCEAGGPLSNILNRLREQEQLYPTGADFIKAGKMIDEELDSFGLHLDLNTDTQTGSASLVWPEEWLQQFGPLSNNAASYLASRGVLKPTAEYFGLLEDAQRRRVVIPIRDRAGRLRGATGRGYENQQPRYFRYTIEGIEYREEALYNEDRVDFDHPVVLAESFFDLYQIREATGYPNLVAAMSVQLYPRQLKTLSMAPHITTFFDHGEGGEKARKQVDTLTVPVVHVVPPPGLDAGEMSLEDIRTLLLQ